MFAINEATQSPNISHDCVRTILLNKYDIVDCEIANLTGYEDANFLIVAVQSIDSQMVQKVSKKVVLKISNPIEARNPSLIEIQNVCKKSQTAYSLLDSQLALSSLLTENGIPNPEIVQQRDGKFWSLEKFGDLCLPVRLFRFMPGKMLQDVKQSGELYSCVGRLLARFHKVTEKFDDSAYRRHLPFLSLENLDCIRRETGLLLELKLVTSEQSQLLEGAFDQYDRRVNSNRDQYEEGFIHSDFNETNILLDVTDKNYEVKAVLDFGDSHYSFRIVDVATAILYLFLDSKSSRDVETEWRFIASAFSQGYFFERPQFQMDGRDLLICGCARLAASLVYGLRTARINARGNSMEYVLRTQSNGWQFLEKLLAI